MKLTEFDFEFPEELVAQSPLPERDQSRLLVWNGRTNEKRDSTFVQLAREIRHIFTPAGQVPVLLVVNDSKVYPARIRIRKETGARGEVFALNPTQEENIACLLRPLKKLRTGDVLFSDRSSEPLFKVVSVDPPRVDNISGRPLSELMSVEGEMPLPPYIDRDPGRVTDPSLCALDRMRYQTVYAREVGSAAAPTAGLHFTPAVLNECAEQNIVMTGVTLHVGLGTFQPVTASDVDDHKMHSEFCSIPKNTMLKILEHVENDWPILFVGTTAFRAVESVMMKILGYSFDGACHSEREGLSQRLSEKTVARGDALAFADQWIETNLFIRPADKDFVYRPLCGNGMLTNFHQPQSTLVMLIASLLGYHQWRELYLHATAERYRLFSYGDSSLLIFPGRG